MQKIIVASKNPIKLEAARLGFQKVFPDEQFEVSGVSVESGAGDQPHGDAETLKGAWNRAESASRTEPDAHFWVGLEGGIENVGDEMHSFSWIVVKSRSGKFGKGKSGTYVLPRRVAELVRQGKELGDADDMVFGHTNSKQQMGAVGILTKNVITRTIFYTDAVVLALVPFVHPELY